MTDLTRSVSSSVAPKTSERAHPPIKKSGASAERVEVGIGIGAKKNLVSDTRLWVFLVTSQFATAARHAGNYVIVDAQCTQHQQRPEVLTILDDRA